MLPEGYRWRETQGHWQLWHNGRPLVMVQPNGDRVRVLMAMSHPTQHVQGSAASMSAGKRYAERWVAEWVKRNGDPE